MESYVGRPDCSVPFVSGDGEVDDVPSQHGEVAHLVVVGVGEICDTGEGAGEGGGRRRGQLITPCRKSIFHTHTHPPQTGRRVLQAAALAPSRGRG